MSHAKVQSDFNSDNAIALVLYQILKITVIDENGIFCTSKLCHFFVNEVDKLNICIMGNKSLSILPEDFLFDIWE